MPKLREFFIDEKYLTDMVIQKEWNEYVKEGQVTSPEDMLKVIAGKGWVTMSYNQDHPEFAQLRDELERLGYIATNRNSWNGDYVLKSFKLNGYIARKGWRFNCATALGTHFRVLKNHPEYDDGYLN